MLVDISQTIFVLDDYITISDLSDDFKTSPPTPLRRRKRGELCGWFIMFFDEELWLFLFLREEFIVFKISDRILQLRFAAFKMRHIRAMLSLKDFICS
jgi:hypothetical protein